MLSIAVLAKVDLRLVNTCWKLSDVFTRRDVCEKYQEGLKETIEVLSYTWCSYSKMATKKKIFELGVEWYIDRNKITFWT